MRIMGRVAAWVAVLGMPVMAWALARAAWALWDGRGAVLQVDDLVAMGAAGIGAAVAGYLAMTGGAMLLAALVRGGRSVPRSVATLAPVSWQRVMAAALGVTMSAGLASPALAGQPSAPQVGWSEPAAAQSVSQARASSETHGFAAGSPVGWSGPVAIAAPAADGGALAVGFAPAPSRTATPHTTTQQSSESAPSDVAERAGSGTYTVERGDSLWRITAKLLGPGASDVSINRAWPQLYAANVDAVGADPALIHPGLVLAVPTGFQS